MAKINPEELIFKEFTNANGDTYRVTRYIGKDGSLKHLYNIMFVDTKHLQTEERTKIMKSKCRDLKKEKANKAAARQRDYKKMNALSQSYKAEYKKFAMQDVPILAVDQASNTGYCVILNNAVKKYGLIERKYEEFYLNACYIVSELTKLIIKYDIKIVFLEGVFLKFKPYILEALSGLKGMIIYCAVLNNCEYEVIHSPSWKTYHQLGYDRKEQKEKSIELARKILNNAEIDDNIADAVLIGVFAAKTLRSD